MARKTSAAFDDVAAAFADYGTTVRGYVRYHLTRRNLKPYLTKKKMQVLDVGGGSGGDTAWLVGLGHHVTYLEPSKEQRRFAERRFNFLLSDKERTRVTLAGKTLNDIPADKMFDLVLVHAVAMYQQEPYQLLIDALTHVKPGGLISMIEKGYYGTQVRDVRDSNFADLRRLRTTGSSINNLRQRMWTAKPEQLENFLQEAGFEILEWSGIRVLTDDFAMPVSRMNAKQLKIILDLEYEQGHNPSIRGQGQLLHFIARRPD